MRETHHASLVLLHVSFLVGQDLGRGRNLPVREEPGGAVRNNTL